MSYVIVATWKAKSGEEEAVLGLLRRMAVAQPPGTGLPALPGPSLPR